MRMIAFALLAITSASAQSNPWDFSQPDAKVAIGLNLKVLRESALGEAFRSQMRSQQPQLGPAGMALGFLDQIDRVFISSAGAASPRLVSPRSTTPRADTAARASATADNPPFLAVIEGTLPVQQFLAFLSGTPRPYRSIDVYRGNHLTDPSIAAFDEHTLVIGDDKSVRAAIDRHAGVVPTIPAPAGSAPQARIQELASKYDFWMLATDSFSKFQPNSEKIPNQLASEIKGIDLGVIARDGMQMEMSMTMTDEAAAKQLLQLVSGLVAFAPMQNPEMAEVVGKLKLSAEGAQFRASIALSQEEFERNLRSMEAARLAAGTNPPPSAVPAAPRTKSPPPPPPGKVRIYGLDEGVREIDVKR